MTIGQLLDELRKFDQKIAVTFDFGHCYPTNIDSWRGSYDEPSIGWASDDGQIHTVAMLINELEKSISSGSVYYGYNGGEYQYTKESPLHVDNKGICSNTGITSICEGKYGWRVVIHTRYESEQD